MPKGLRHRYGLRHLNFITCSCYGRPPLFASARTKNLFVKILGEVRDRRGFALVGYVVMPNHIHLLISEPANGIPYAVTWPLTSCAPGTTLSPAMGRRKPALG